MATTAEVGKEAPDFILPADGGGTVKLSDLRGKKVVLYFYPKDDTPGCTKEACGYHDALPDFYRIQAVILGLSKDSVAKHDKFKSKYELPLTLASDEEGTVCEAYCTWVEKSIYSRKYIGIDRATFLIDEDGTLRPEWRRVKVPGHVDAVLQAARQM